MLSQEDKSVLLQVTKDSIAYGLTQHKALPVKTTEYSTTLQELGAAFITLNLHNNLRGCIGSLEAHRPLVEDISENAYAAAFRDPRFEALSESEFKALDYHISVIKPAVDFPVYSEEDLVKQLRPSKDGLILEEGINRATFLPSVWQTLPQAEDFLAHLKLKAGLPKNYWSDSIKFKRYEVEEFSEA